MKNTLKQFNELLLRASFFGFLDLKRRFKMSILGSLWSVLSVIIISLIIFNVLSGLSIEGDGYSDLVVGLYVWSFASGFITESSSVFVSSAGLLKNTRLRIVEVYMRFFCCHSIQWVFNSFFISAYLVLTTFDFYSAMALLFFLIIYGPILFVIGIVVGIVGARFRDLPSMISIILQITFYATPILWSSSMLSLDPFWNNINLFYYMISWVREPHFSLVFFPYLAFVPIGCLSYWIFIKKIRRILVYWT